MDEKFFKISSIEKKMYTNSIMKTAMKVIAVMIVFVIFACCNNQPDTMRVAWIISITVLCLLFGIDVYYSRRNKKYEFEIYQLEAENLRIRKEAAEITGEILPDTVFNQEIVMPSDEIKYPIAFYVIVLAMDVIIRIIMIH